LVIRGALGLAVITGCSHPGIVKMMEIIEKRFSSKVYLVTGGLHLKDSSREDINHVGQSLKQLGVQYLAPIHCTGHMAQGVLREIFKDNYIVLQEGQEINVDL